LTRFSFDEISHGQRTIIALYALLFGLKCHEYSFFIDEPDNFLALPEIQPWLNALIDKCDLGEIVQAVLISHHPELIDFLGISRGILFERGLNGHIRTRKAADVANGSGLKLSETIARGWEK
jgi:AAA15 family ATPase/GTPase